MKDRSGNYNGSHHQETHSSEHGAFEEQKASFEELKTNATRDARTLNQVEWPTDDQRHETAAQFALHQFDSAREKLEGSGIDEVAKEVIHGKLDRYETIYANTLHYSQENTEAAAGVMAEILNQAEFCVSGNTQEKAARGLDFHELKEQTGNTPSDDLKDQLKRQLRESSTTLQGALESVGRGSPGVIAADALDECYAHIMRSALEENEEEQFVKAISHSEHDNFSFAHAVRDETGFIAAKSHRPPKFPGKFRNPKEGIDYLNRAGQALEKAEMDPVYRQAAERLLIRSEELLELNLELDRKKDPARFQTTLETAHENASGLNYFLQPGRKSR